MRGKPLLADFLPDLLGITPAHAGKTESAAARGGEPRDHPRACGENQRYLHQHERCRGSPPRMRGKPRKHDIVPNTAGITPAHAGKTRKLVRREVSRRDHPRACGENRLQKSISAFGSGSPPRMRGKHPHTAARVTVPRITPAHAGKTRGRFRFQKRPRDHPRACGENTSEMAYFRG